jgi:hypothetical protein
MKSSIKILKNTPTSDCKVELSLRLKSEHEGDAHLHIVLMSELYLLSS